MPQVDTGMGWSANSDYLKTSSGGVAQWASIGGTDFPGQPVPLADANALSFDFVCNNGFNCGTVTIGQVCDIYVMSTSPTVLVAKTASTDFPYVISYGAKPTDVIAYAYKRRSDGANYGYGSWPVGGTADPSTGLSYYHPESGYPWPDATALHTFPDIRTMLDSVTISETWITKENVGYAVACMATWYTPEGVEQTSPILISSDETLVDMAVDGYSQYKNIRLYDGMTFYMSMFLNLPKNVTSQLPAVDLRQFGAAAPSKVFALIADDSIANIVVLHAPDPYEDQTGASEEDGGDGDDIQDDDIDFAPVPSSMAVASGFITLFCPSQYELNSLADYMWGPLFDVDTIKKLFANPMDCILGLSVIPVPIVPEGTKTVKVGGVSTTVSMGYTNHQYYPVDCGSITIPKRWGAYMDYSPYTKFNIFLPYIGFRSISADDVMGKTLHLRYMIDILSGACNAELKCNGSVLYSWAGSCAMQIPITGNDWRSAITAGVSIAGSVAATVLSGGASAPMIAGTVASATVNSLALKPEVQRSGSISSASGFLAAQRPYIVRTNPRSAIPANQNTYHGYPSFVTVGLGSLTGYNEVYSIHLENVPATGQELDEIESLLKGGVIF